MLWLRLAIRELRRDSGFSLFFILNLSIGLVGFIALNSFNNSLQLHIKNNLKEILTADLVISSSAQISDAANKIIESVIGKTQSVAKSNNSPTSGIKESRQISFFSMISSSDSKLANIIAIDGAFPLYGNILSDKIDSDYVSDSGISDSNALPSKVNSSSLNQDFASSTDIKVSKAWVSRDIALGMNLTIGSTVKIGDSDFVVDNIVIPPPDASVSSFELAPKIYIGLSDIEKTGLVKFGSRVRFKRFYSFPSGTDVKAKTVELRNKINTLFDGSPTMSIYDSEDVNQNLKRIFGYFTGYMGLIGVVALFLAGIGTAYLFRGHLNTKLKEIAILMSLGARRIDAYMLFMWQVVILGSISTIFSVILSFLILPLFPEVLQGLIPPGFYTTADMNSVITAFVPGIFGSIIFCLPVFVRVHTLKPVILLHGLQIFNSALPARSIINFLLSLKIIKTLRLLSSFLPAILTFWLLSVGQTKSFGRGTIFFVGYMSVMAAMTAVGWSILYALKRLSLTDHFIRKIAFRNLYRNKMSSISCFVTIAMGAFLINVIPQIKNGIQDEISQPEGMRIPGFFLIDIQPEQLAPLTQFLESKHYTLTNVSPIIRGRILTVNGKGFYERLEHSELLGKKERDNGSFGGAYRRREFNFSYREFLDQSEKIVKGKPLNQTTWGFSNSVEKMEISLEEGFADRFDLKIDDTITFNIQGMAFEGKVVNLRKVRWNSFQPNFFILFQKGVLEDAPKTFLASIPQMKPSERQRLQNSLVKQFPNISVLDVNQTVKQILNITDRLSFAINFMASLAIVAGLVVLFSIARYETHGRSWEINLLKVLGAGFGDIRKIILLEFGFLGFMATFFATILSLLVSYCIAWFFFERLWSFRWEYSLFCLVAITLICIATAMAATAKVIRQKSAGLLSE